MPARSVFTRFIPILLVLTGICSSGLQADTRTYEATTDFPVLDAGIVPYYSEAPGRASLAINAAIESYRDVFARATVVYDGTEGIHDFTLVALAELDGEADYQLLINGEVVGTASNPEVEIDYTVVRHSFPNINVPVGAVIAVESLANTNGKIPENDGTAFARGRWTALELFEVDSEQETTTTPMDIDVGLIMTSDKQTLTSNESFELELIVANAEDSITATQPIVRLSLPLQQLTVVSAEQCVSDADDLVCAFSELPAGGREAMPLILSSGDATGPFTVTASVSADQDDRDGTNNSVSISFDESDSGTGNDTSTDSDTGTDTGTDTDTDTNTNTNTNTNTDTDTDTDTDSDTDTQNQTENTDSAAVTTNASTGGSASLAWLLLILPLSFRISVRQRA